MLSWVLQTTSEGCAQEAEHILSKVHELEVGNVQVPLHTVLSYHARSCRMHAGLD